MRIVHIIPGSGGRFYCENCLRDSALVRALRDAGHDVIVAPFYLGLPEEEFGRPAGGRVFMGAVSLYVSSLTRSGRLSAWAARLLDSRPVLGLAARLSGSTDPGSLDELTFSMLEGRGAFQEEALGELINWLRGLGRIDLVHISNALLLHPAERIKAELSLPIVVSLQDEDSWIDGLPEGRRPQAWDILARKAAAADVFIASSAYFAERMRLALRLSADSVRVVYPGIRAAEYRLGEPGRHDIGYLSRICQRMGFGILARAYALLRRMPGLSDLRMSASGGGGAQDARFLAQTKRFLRAEGCEDGLTLRAAFDKVARVDFLAGLGLLSVPAPAGEAFGAFQLEAMAAGLPLVQPRAGGFVEAIEEAGCGILTEDAEPESLAAGIERVLGDQALARALGERGRKAVETVFSDRAMAEATLAAYTRAIEAGGGRKV